MLVDQHNTAGLMFGTVTAVDAVSCCIRVRLPERDGMLTHWLAVPQRNTHKNQHRSLPDLGGHVAVLLAANGVDGVYLGAIYCGTEPPPITDDDTEYVRFADGSTVSHDRQNSRMQVRSAAQIEIIAASRITLQAPEIALDGNATVTGTLLVDQSLTAQGGMQVRGGSGSTATISGKLQVDGDINASGTVMDAGGNSNHHRH